MKELNLNEHNYWGSIVNSMVSGLWPISEQNPDAATISTDQAEMNLPCASLFCTTRCPQKGRPTEPKFIGYLEFVCSDDFGQVPNMWVLGPLELHHLRCRCLAWRDEGSTPRTFGASLSQGTPFLESSQTLCNKSWNLTDVYP